MTVYGYTRVSTAEQAADDRTSLETQRRKIAAAAELSGLTLDALIEEPGVSGTKPLAARPEGGPLLARLQKGDALIVAKLDRAFRNAADALATAEQLKARKVDLIVADMGSEPVTQNGVSRMFFGMLALVAEFERERTRERLADGRGAKRAAGGHIDGRVSQARRGPLCASGADPRAAGRHPHHAPARHRGRQPARHRRGGPAAARLCRLAPCGANRPAPACGGARRPATAGGRRMTALQDKAAVADRLRRALLRCCSATKR